jgi:hypothetical protein
MAYATAELQQVLDSHADQIGARIGADPAQTQAAISAALPALLAGLQQQAGSGTGLQQAIENDHDGSILVDVSGYVNGTAQLSPRTTNGAGILDHVLGDQQPAVQQAVSNQTGLSMSTIGQLLPILAPIVMGMLGRQARSGSAGSTGGMGDLGSILGSLGGLGAGSTTGSGTGGLGDVLGSVLGGNRTR